MSDRIRTEFDISLTTTATGVGVEIKVRNIDTNEVWSHAMTEVEYAMMASAVIEAFNHITDRLIDIRLGSMHEAHSAITKCFKREGL